jgi:Predicted membrane protein (DUF2306)
MIKTISYYLLIFFAIIVAGYAIVGYIILKPGSIAAPEMLVTYNSNIWNKLNIMLHAGFASIALLTGLFQMSTKWRQKFPKWNIRLRNIYYFSVMVASVTGLYLAFIARGGLPNLYGFGTLAIIWFFATLKAFLASYKNRDMPNFRIWIVRSYALTTTAISLRIYYGLWIAIMGYSTSQTFYAVLGFFTWVPTFIITEWWILPRLHNTLSKIKTITK